MIVLALEPVPKGGLSGRGWRDSEGVSKPFWNRDVDPTTRRQHSRVGLRYETDLTDAEWALIEPHLPPSARAWTPALLADARDHERDLLCPARGHRLAAPPA